MLLAKVDLTDDIKEFINYSKNHTESFEEIRKLVFTKERLSKPCTASDIVNLSFQFQRIKDSAINKILHEEVLNFPEGLLIERLLAKYTNEEYIPVEEHIKQIKLNSCNDRKSKRENERKVSKLYDRFIHTLFKH